MKILYVDDSRNQLFISKKIINKISTHEVITAMSLKQAIGCIAKHTDIDLIVTDYYMIAETGEDIANMVISLKIDVPVVLLTGRKKNAIACSNADLFDLIVEKSWDSKDWQEILKKYKDL